MNPGSVRAEVRRTRVDVDDGVESKNAPCGEVIVAARAPVTGRTVGPRPLEIPFGDTDERGAMVIELADALPPTLYREASAGAKLTLYVGISEVGTMRLDEVASAVEERAWSPRSAEARAMTGADEPCGRVERHLRDFPTGRHAAEAQSALARASAGLPGRKRAEEARRSRRRAPSRGRSSSPAARWSGRARRGTARRRRAARRRRRRSSLACRSSSICTTSPQGSTRPRRGSRSRRAR